MAKSRLSASRNKNIPILHAKTKSNIEPFGLDFELHQRGVAYSIKFNLLDWCHEQCDPKRPLATPSRLKKMQGLRRWVDSERDNQTSESYIRTKLHALKQYIVFCDFKKLDPFCQAGYISYVGNTGELRRLVEAAHEQKKYQFQYYDGEEAGLLESTAFSKKLCLDSLLSVLDFDVSSWQATIKPFSQERIDSSTQPYSDDEWHALIRRTQLFFFSTATQLIAFKDENPEAKLPDSLDGIVVDRNNDRSITIDLKGDKGAGTPFNQCMAAAYCLIAYYTAFNDTVIKDLRHPIKVVTSKNEGRTSKTIQVRAYKGRSSKDVKALFVDSLESSHPEASGNGVGFIVADINKREKFGSVDGVSFLQTLETLSKAYSDDPFDTLIYFLNSEGEKAKVSIEHALMKLSWNLNLLSDNRNELTNHLVKTYTDIVEHQKIYSFKWGKREDNARFMKKESIALSKKGVTHRAVPIAYAALSCMTDAPLRNALLPLQYSDKDSNGSITVSFKYVDGSEGQFTIAAKYRSFLQLVERYAETRSLPSRENLAGTARGTQSVRPCFLLPLGSKSTTAQWNEGQVPISTYLLSQCGIGYGDYFLNITSGRIRATHSDLEYKPEERGLTAQKILQHSIDMADKRYRNGHPVSNNKQLSQGLMTLVHIASGKTRSEAIESVKKALEIPILEYETWKKRNQPTNPNGISCDGVIDLVSEKDWHYASRKFAEEKGFITEGQDITCYQYDLCIFCKSAKLVDDPYAIYKLLSFLDVLSEGIDQYPERAELLQSKIERFQVHLDDLPLETIEKAEDLFDKKGRYPLFDSLASVTQFL
ncbi:hypothetical protein R7E79_19950 [Vibrio sp. Vb2135]|uniref:hypothetical protein n=1 Tax=Vibrio sp. Vb2135 TaxID=3074653 RepID=UPI002964B835|nr:hypothetical protein [Vibrio sp. Vb2135]MDW1764607.1 hypothetical protein [Vibrio sp. Vb2135]